MQSFALASSYDARGAEERSVASPVDDRVQNGRVCQKYVALTEANATEYIAQIQSETGSYPARRPGPRCG